MPLPSVAVAGGTGNLGSKIVTQLLASSSLPRFRDLIVLARAESDKTRGFQSQGATVRVYSEDNLTKALDGVDVLINTVGPSGHHFKEKLLRALPQTSVKLYFPSEFGVDHYVHDFPHEEWDAKKKHYRLAQEVISNIRICRVYAGLFLEDSIGPWFGFDTKHGRYEAVGSPDQITSYTSMRDVGRALGVLSTLDPGKVPEQVHLSGDSKSMAQVARIMEEASGEKEGGIEVTSVPLAEYKADVFANPRPTPERYLRFLMAEGLIDHTEKGLGNDNALVEGAEGFGRWQSLKDLAGETGGKPWGDAEWP
ncbi:isoflavone reductase family protein [Plectosphaerella cucumerina]|uniref:Isoflavone reductase family protein n=1 Tax=Plectosphaerella cucumerina TaxID=40658 RepID=A0A8K0TKI1_9PEZI|nr:isoflavone reductase family protein [Plectosphaerella cucumerina]